MINVLWEIIIPLLLAFLIGLFIGWLLWRWRRTRVSSTEWTQTAEDKAAAERKAAQFATTNGELDERVGVLDSELTSVRGQLVRVRSEHEVTSGELTSAQSALSAATARADEQQSLLSASTTRVAELESGLSASTARVGELEGELRTSQAQVEKLDASLADTSGRVSALEGELSGTRTELQGFASMPGELSTTQNRVGELESDVAAANDRAASLESELDSARGRASTLEAELGAATGRVSTLESDLGLANDRVLALESELGAANGRVGQLEDDLAASHGRVSVLEADLSGAQTELQAFAPMPDLLEGERSRRLELDTEVADAHTRLGQLEGELAASRSTAASLEQQLNTANANVTQLQGDLTSAREEISGFADLPPQLDAAHSTATEQAAEIERLERELAKDCGHAAVISELEERLAAEKASNPVTSWREGTTKLGTPGANHVDDLKEISGIGPKMERLLNDFGITTWEQIAYLSDDEVSKVDGALEEFPGRIERDEWVPQAKAFMAAGHEPVAWERSAPTPEWQHGTTKLGTPGAGHTDDLKVINGIGPKMEAVLLSFGIQSWEQIGAFTASDIELVSGAIDAFPGRIERDEWVGQAEELVKRFPEISERPTRDSFLNRSNA